MALTAQELKFVNNFFSGTIAQGPAVVTRVINELTALGTSRNQAQTVLLSKFNAYRRKAMTAAAIQLQRQQRQAPRAKVAVVEPIPQEREPLPDEVVTDDGADMEQVDEPDATQVVTPSYETMPDAGPVYDNGYGNGYGEPIPQAAPTDGGINPILLAVVPIIAAFLLS